MSELKKIKVMFIVGSLSKGGAERFVANALNNLPKDQFDLYAALQLPDRDYAIPEETPIKVLHKSKAWHNITAGLRLKRWIDQIKPDIIISARSATSIFTAGVLCTTKHKRKWLARIANAPTHENLGFYRMLTHFCYKRADGFIAVSTGLCKEFEKKYPFSEGLVTTIHNAVDIDSLEKKAEENITFPTNLMEAQREQIPIIISIGRLEKQKRFDVLLSAFAKTLRQTPAFLVILGEGSSRKDLEALARELSIEDSVLMPGFATNPHAWLMTADIFSLSSDFEGMSNALIEAQALGLPAVATNCPFGTAEVIINEKTGILTETGNIDQLSEGLTRLLQNKDLRAQFSTAAKKNIQCNFSMTKHIKLLTELLATNTDAQ